jgi:hypothetical protein
MRKFLYVFGAAALATAVALVVGIGILIWKGNGLDAESKAYVDAAVPAITSHWDKNALLDRAGPELRAATTPGQIANLFDNFSRLGPLVHYEGATGQANMAYYTGKGGQITAVYEAKAKYEHGEATLRLNLMKHDGVWTIVGFRVDGPPGARTSQAM